MVLLLFNLNGLVSMVLLLLKLNGLVSLVLLLLKLNGLTLLVLLILNIFNDSIKHNEFTQHGCSFGKKITK
jgi:hypothetical protein